MSNNSGRRAATQAADRNPDSPFASTRLELGDNDFIEIPPHPNFRLFDDERLAEYEALLIDVEEHCDREPDVYIPGATLDDGAVLPGQIRRGILKQPLRKGGEPLNPPHSVQVVQTVLGEQDWKRLKDAGKCAADVWRIWNDQGIRMTERTASDPFRVGRG